MYMYNPPLSPPRYSCLHSHRYPPSPTSTVTAQGSLILSIDSILEPCADPATSIRAELLALHKHSSLACAATTVAAPTPPLLRPTLRPAVSTLPLAPARRLATAKKSSTLRHAVDDRRESAFLHLCHSSPFVRFPVRAHRHLRRAPRAR